MKDMHISDVDRLLSGAQWARIGHTFFTNSALFPLFNFIRVACLEGIAVYFSELPNYFMLLAAFVQAFVIGTWKLKGWACFGANLIGPLLYTIIDLPLEGWEFFSEPYHWVFWGYGFLMGFFEAMHSIDDQASWRHDMWHVARSLVRTLLFPVVYYLSEIGIESDVSFSYAGWIVYMASAGHQFIFVASILFGILLGIADGQASHYENLLKQAARQLKQYADWGFGSDLIKEALRDPYKLKLKRVTRTILFIDIRSFTTWAEQQSPDIVAEMLSQFYRASEQVITRFHGLTPAYLGDGIVTRFEDTDLAVSAAIELGNVNRAALQPWGLRVGIGLDRGEVMEGLLGGKDTRQFDAIGDPVNTAARVCGIAKPGEILISSNVYDHLRQVPAVDNPREVNVKGKHQSLTVYALQPDQIVAASG